MGESTLTILNKSTGDEIHTLEVDDRSSAFAKLDRAFEHYKANKTGVALHQRIVTLKKIASLLEARKQEFAQLIAAEGGKPLKDAKVEADRAVQGVEIAIEVLSTEQGQVVPLGMQASSANKRARTQPFPRGVVLAYSAFNHPLNLTIHQIIPAYAVGCPALIKPARDTPLCCSRFVALMHEAGVSKEEVDTLILNETSIATELAESDKLAFFSFIGSAKVGWMLRSKLAAGTRCAMEHGGVAPCVLTASADLDMAIPKILKGAYYHAGQVCVSTQKLFVHAEIKDSVLKLLREGVEALKTGDAGKEDTDVGPLIRTDEVSRVAEWVDEAKKEGAECLTGGEMISERFYAPTLLLNPSDEAKVSNEEVFGPVLCVYEYKDLEDAIARCNHPEFAFQAAIFSRQTDEVEQFYQQVDAATIMVNENTAFRHDAMPFAGLKHSGFGVGGIPYTMEDMQYEKLMVESL